MLPLASKRYRSRSQPRGNCRHFPVPALLGRASFPLAAVIWMSHETLLSSLPCGGEKRREGREGGSSSWETAIAGNGGAATSMELCGIRHGWLMGHSSSLTAPSGAGGGVFLVRAVSRGVGFCFWEELGSPVQAGPTEVCATACIPKALQSRQQGMGSRVPEAGSAGVSVSGAFGSTSCHRFAL